MKKLKTIVASIGMTLLLAGSASAHIVVKPGDVATGTFQTFTMGVPNEKGGNVTTVKLLIPENVSSVTPTEKVGWTIETEKTGTGEEAVTKSITWSGGKVSEGRRDDFTFSAKTSDEAGEIQWKAYETYDNGVTIAWDKTSAEQPKKTDGSPDFSTSGPLSVTKVSAKTDAAPASVKAGDSEDNTARTLAGAALAVGLLSFAVATRKKNK